MKEWKPEYDILALYNAEVSRGIVHTPEWHAKMKIVQKEYDKEVLGKRR